jgi:hypothetical protein
VEKAIKKKAPIKKKVAKRAPKKAAIAPEVLPAKILLDIECCGSCQYRYVDEYEEGSKKCRRFPSRNYNNETRIIHNAQGGFDHREVAPVHPYVDDCWPECGEYKKIQLTGGEK